jgi:hypothetical protein
VQLPGMSTEPVRVSLEVTWWPSEDSWSIARRGWRRDHDNAWNLEEMFTSASPMTRTQLIESLENAVSQLTIEVRESEDPFSTVGAFR